MKCHRLALLGLIGCLGSVFAADGFCFAQAPQTRNQAGLGRPQPRQENQNGLVGPQRRPAQIQPPFPALNSEHQKYVDDILKLWEEESKKIERYRCNFRRWEYDPVFGPKRDPKTGVASAKTISIGMIKYMAPDKGMLKVEKIYEYRIPRTPKDDLYVLQKKPGEYWICDGKSIFDHNYREKQLTQIELPPEMQGIAISNGPLPFMFGSKAKDLKNRYWIRPLEAPHEGEHKLEAFPRRPEDAANFKKVQVVIDEKFLPKAIILFPPNYEERLNPVKTVYEFNDRDINWSLTERINQLNPFSRDFDKPKTPRGWTKVVQRFGAAPPVQNAQPAPKVARPKPNGLQRFSRRIFDIK